jgi:hypothetical protein
MLCIIIRRWWQPFCLVKIRRSSHYTLVWFRAGRSKLSVEKQDTSRRDTYSNAQGPAASGFGKVLGSIQGLRQRLGEFSLEDISTAETKVRSLVKQLIALRDNLDDLAQLKHVIIESHRRIHDIPELNFDLISLDSLEKHPQLHAIVQASKLIRFHRLMKAAQASADAVTFDSESNEFRIPETPATHEGRAPSRPQTVAAVEEQEIALEQNLTESERQTTAADHGSIDGLDTIDTTVAIAAPPQELKQSLAVSRGESSPARSIEESFSAQTDQDDNPPMDWSFDLGEVSSTVGENSSASAHFVFPDETFSDQTPATMDSAKIIVPPPALSAVNPAPIPDSRQSRELIVSKDKLDTKKSGAPAEAQIDASRARNPDDSAIDQRLLDELIENYGDFAATRNLPATLEASKPAAPKYDNPAVETSPLFDEPIATERQLSNVKKAGDLDRQLKKIIKDYGENDLYPRQSLVNLKTGGIAAFAVLGLVLGALYLFKAPKAASPIQARPVAPAAEIQKAAAAEVARPNNTVGVKGRLAEPEAANAGTDPLTESKQEP